MKTLRFIILFILLSLITLPQGSVVSAPGRGKNLAPNPSFEEGKFILADWKSYSLGTEWTLSWVSDVAYHGKHSVCISSTIANSNGGWWMTINQIPFPREEVYILGAYVKGDLIGDAYIGEMQFDDNGTPVPTGDIINVTFNNETWTYNQLYFGKQLGATVFDIRLGVNFMGNPNQSGTICFDYISVRGSR